MKRVISLVLALMLMLGLCACKGKKDLNKIIPEAEKTVSELKAIDDIAYAFSSEYSESDKIFTIILKVDMDRIIELYDQYNLDWSNDQTISGMYNLLHNEKQQKENLAKARAEVEPLFEGTDVKVRTIFRDDIFDSGDKEYN